MKLTKGFELLATAPDGVARLRELILSLAVQGKLVSQDGNDENASELIEEIRSEKIRWISEGKLRREKSLPDIRDVAKPFQLPEGWTWAYLGEISNFGSTTKLDVIPDGAWVLDLEDIEKDTSRLIRKVRFHERGSLSDKNAFAAGDVLYGKLRPYLNKVLVADEEGVCTTEIIPIRCYGGLDPHYLKWVLKSPYFLEYVNARSYGMKMPRLGTDDGRKALIPLPPLAEQARIVAKVDELMRLCDKLEASGRLETEQHARLTATLFEALDASESTHALAENWSRVVANFDLLLDRPEAVDALEQTILQLAVRGRLVPQNRSEEPANALLGRIADKKAELAARGGLRTTAQADVPEDERYLGEIPGWEYCRLGNLAKFIDYRGKTPQKTEAGIPLITAKNVRIGYINREPREFISESDYETWMTRGFPRVGDLLFTTEAPLGNIATVDIEERFALAQRVICFQLHEAATGPYVQLAIMSAPVQALLLAAASGMTATGIKASRLKEIPLAIPPLAEQQRIVARVEELRHLCASLRARLTDRQICQARLAAALVEQAAAGLDAGSLALAA